MIIINGYNIESGADLRGANLREANLRGFDLRGVDLTGANLIGANLIGAKLEGAKLEGADLRKANLKGANLTGAILTGAKLPQASSLNFCLALNSNIKGAITTVDQLLDLIKSSESNSEESAICKDHLKWIENNMGQLIQYNYITDEDKVKIDDYYRDKIDFGHLSQCSTGTNKEGPDQGLTGAVQSLCVKGELGSSDKGQER